MKPSYEELEAQVAELNAWKESALSIEKDWDAQRIAKLMDLPLGSNIRKEIEPYILRMNSNLFKSKEKIERLEKALRFYANEKNYSEEGVPGNFIPGHTAGGNIQDPDFEPDFGHKANQALGLKP